tara:strand:- start:3387 stop:3605 length:219 start_codon:yes stop_codon:yes gene_type:complete
MVSKKLIKDYELSDIQSYYDMCLDSHTNGQITQATKQARKMSPSQRIGFLNYMEEFDLPEEVIFFRDRFVGA